MGERSQTHQTIHIKHHNVTPGPPPVDHRIKPCPPQVNLISRPSILLHNLRCLRLIHPDILLAPQIRRIHPAIAGVRVQRREIQWGEVEEYEVPATEAIEGIGGGEDAGDVVGDGFAGDLGVGEEGVVA